MKGVVLYDGHCRFCTRAARQLAALARPGAVEMRDFQAPGALDAYPSLTHDACMRAMQLVTEDGRVYSGAEAVARVLATRPVVGLAAWLYYAPGLRALADAGYAWVAANRYRLLGRQDACEDEACAVHLAPAPTSGPRADSLQSTPMSPQLKALAVAVLVLAVGFAAWRFLGTAPTPMEAGAPASGLDPSSAESVARAAAAEFQKGNYALGYQMMAKLGDRPLTRVLGADVQKLMDRVNGALTKANEARSLFNQKQYESAAKLMDEAAREYPEAADLRLGAEFYLGYAAFERKDYELYLKLADKAAAGNPENLAMVLWQANALGTQYAVTGDDQYKKRAEETLTRAQQIAAASSSGADAKSSVEAVAGRVRDRIATRKIISQEEYDAKIQKQKR